MNITTQHEYTPNTKSLFLSGDHRSPERKYKTSTAWEIRLRISRKRNM